MKYGLLLLIIALSSAFQSNVNSQLETQKQEINIVKSFYSKYFEAYWGGSDNQSLTRIVNSYLTKKCIIRNDSIQEKMDMNPIINGQDLNDNWRKTLKVEPLNKREHWYVVFYIESYSNSKISIEVIKVKEKFQINTLNPIIIDSNNK